MYQFFISDYFKRQIKKYNKKYRSLTSDITLFLESFDPNIHISLGEGVYKARISVSSMNKGKSKSFRLVLLLIQQKNFITPIVFYYKGDKESISKREIQYHLDQIAKELKNL